ncbi:MAG: ferrous iron transporter B [Myxococcota bacterium]|nr:ferrous iron transporter B [Myxococcota bacterium]
MTAVAPPPGLRIGLIGSPNAGKTTLFNALTGLRARVGNYPGVTVERREGSLTLGERRAVIIDLPGTYSLDTIAEDERVVTRVLAGELDEAPDAVAVVADACSLPRSLMLVSQVMRRGLPTCLVLTMIDELRARRGELDIDRLQASLGIPVVGVVGHRGLGIDRLRELLERPEQWDRPVVAPPEDALERAGWVDSIVAHTLHTVPEHHRASEAIDRVLLHPVWGTLIFAAVMIAFFQLIFAWATPAMDALDHATGSAAHAVRLHVPPGLFADFLADGLIAGVGAVLVFLPQIALLFALLYLLEDVGYMARAAFVVDRVFGRAGLEGRSFIALLSSYACAGPGIMATRSIPSPRDRLVTILVAPLMTCSARLPVYILLVSAFVPRETVLGPIGLQGLVMLGLYLLGATGALGVAAVFKRTLLRGEGLPFTMELPSYRWPTIRLWASQLWGSVWAFVRRAGTIILGLSIVLWFLITFPRTPLPPELPPAEASSLALANSYAGQLGHAIEPAIAPLGFDWKIGVGLVASLAAREVIVSTLAQIYATEDESRSLQEAIRGDIDPRTGQRVFTNATVASLLVFFVFALQCASTLAVMRRETNSWRWPAFAFGYLLALAYSASFLTYRTVLALGGGT